MTRGHWIWDREKKKFKRFGKEKPKDVHSVIQDTLKVPVYSLADWKKTPFESKSAYRRHLKANGFRETGGEHIKDKPNYREIEQKEDEERTKDIEQAYFDVKYGRVEFTEQEKQNHIEEERRWGKKYKVRAPY